VVARESLAIADPMRPPQVPGPTRPLAIPERQPSLSSLIELRGASSDQST
jgi:hypothetical protein